MTDKKELKEYVNPNKNELYYFFKSKGLSQEQIATDTGLSHDAVHRFIKTHKAGSKVESVIQYYCINYQGVTYDEYKNLLNFRK